MAKIRKAVKMADIAEKLDVSTVTVSKALSGQKGVSEEVREKIKELAGQLGYKIPAAVDKNEQKSYDIGVLVLSGYLEDHDSFYWKMYQEVANRANQKECFTMFEIISEEREQKNKLPRLLEENKVDGLIIIGKPGYTYMAYLKKNVKVPIVAMDFYEPDANVDCFVSDGFYGAYVLANYLFNLGHTEIAYVGTLFATDSITDRYLGYVKSLMEHGVEPRKEYVIEDRAVNSGVRDNYVQFELPAKMPTAFVCNCDYVASLIIKALREKGYRVPEDISVVGYDDYLYPGLCDTGITTYAVDIREMAKEAIDVLMKNINGDDYRKGIHIVGGYLVEKESTSERKKE